MSPDALPTVDQLCADPQAAAQLGPGCTAVDDQTFQHVGMWIIVAVEGIMFLAALLAVFMLVSLAWSAFRAAMRSLGSA